MRLDLERIRSLFDIAKINTEGIRFGEREQEAARKLSEYLDVPLPWK